MRIITFASGSSGNCSLISDGRANILIDAGISMRRITAALKELGLTPHDLCGVLITHEHSDHISGLSMLTKHYGVNIFAPERLCEILRDLDPYLTEHLNPMPRDESTDMRSVSVSWFRTPHDSGFSAGYRLEGSAVMAVATDTGCITNELLSGLEGAELALIEANHDVEMLKNGPYPYTLRRRILSDRGHLSNDDCALLAKHLEKTGTRYIILGHLSRENNVPELALRTVGSVLGEETKLFAAPMNGMLEVTVGDTDA